MEIYLPVAEMSVYWLAVLAIGGVVGLVSGMFGVSGGFLLTPVFFTDTYSRGRKVAYSALLLFLIGMSQSRGAWGDTLGMLLFVGWLHLVRRVRKPEVAPLVLITTTAGITITALAIHFWPVLAASMGKDPSMTGRTEIYHEVWLSIMKPPRWICTSRSLRAVWTTPWSSPGAM